MAEIDQWLAEATQLTAGPGAPALLASIEHELSKAPSPRAYSSRRDARRMMACAGMAALLSFTGAGVTGAFAKSPPTWLATPSASSPYALLVGQ